MRVNTPAVGIKKLFSDNLIASGGCLERRRHNKTGEKAKGSCLLADLNDRPRHVKRLLVTRYYR